MKVLFAATMLLLTATSHGAPPQRALTLREYDAELDRWSHEIARLEKNPREARRQRDLPPSWTVEDHGQRWESPTEWLNSGLDKIAKDAGAARTEVPAMQARLTALRAAAASFQTGASEDRAARHELREILARPEFNPQESWFDRWKRKAWAWIAKALDWLGRRVRMPRMPDVSLPFLRILVAALILATIYFLSRRFLFRPGHAVAPAPDPLPASRRAWLDFGRRAAQAEDAGDHREAIRLAYWAGIYRLEELGVWRAESTRTHREYLRMLGSDAAQRGPLAAITRSFELSWYGGQPASADEFHDVANHLETMGCQLPSNPATATS
jgi:hypothetical protein